MSDRMARRRSPETTVADDADDADGVEPATASGARALGWAVSGIVARLDALVAERDAGDLTRAATRCGVPADALRRLGTTLADDAPGGDDAAAGAAVLAAAARGYGVDPIWLVTGVEDFHGERLAPAARVRVAELLLEVGRRLLRARRGAVPPPPQTAYDSRHDDDPPP